MGIDVAEKARDFNERLVKVKIHTQQSEMVNDPQTLINKVRS